MKKFSVVKILSLACLCVVLLGALAFAVFAAEDEKVEIVANNIYYGDTIQLMYAVNAPEGATIKATNPAGKEINVLYFGEQTVKGVPCTLYILETGSAAQAIDTVITFTVEYNGKVAAKSYSVLQYLYTRIDLLEGKVDAGTASAKETAEVEMLKGLLEYSMLAAKFFSIQNNTTFVPFDSYQYVIVDGLTVNGVNPTGMYAPGSKPFANIDAVDYDETLYDLAFNVNGAILTLDELKAFEVGSEEITVSVELVERNLGSAENPILVTLGEYGSAFVTVPAKTTYYFQCYQISSEMIFTVDGETPADLVYGSRITPTTFSIKNDTEEDYEYYLYASYPEGHMENPAVLFDGENVANVTANSQGYFFTFVADGEGKLTLTFSSDVAWSYTVNNLTQGIYGDIQVSIVDGVVNPAVFDLVEGDEYQIIVNTVNPDDAWATPEGTVTVNASVEYPLGSIWNPVLLIQNETKVTIPAGATYNFSSRINGADLYVNGEFFCALTANMWAPQQFTITNESDADTEYTLTVVLPLGSMDNPADLVIGENVANVSEGSQGYFYTWTAPAAGKLTLTISAGENGWFYVVNNMTSYVYGDSQWSDSDPVVNPVVITVAEGDELQIIVNAYDPANPWTAPAGAVTVTAAFEATPVEMTIEEALAATEGTKVVVSGTVCEIYAPWNDTYKNISVYICDAEGNKFLCYQMETLVVKGDIITVTGVIGVHNDTKQLAKGGTAIITGHDASYDVVASEVTIEEALELPDGTDIVVTGTVIRIDGAWDSYYGNMNVTIKDETGKELYLYRLATQVNLNDVVKVTGSMATYNGARQVAQGATAEVVGTHECTDLTEATCNDPVACKFCGEIKGEALGHDYDVDGNCTRCDAQKPGDGATTTTRVDLETISKTNTSYATATTTSGWKAENAAILGGAASGNNNPNFTFISTDASVRAVCLNGKTTAAGKLTSGTLNGGISKLTFDYGLPFGDTKIGLEINIIQNGEVVATKTISNNSATKFEKYTCEWDLDNVVEGEFTIEIKNTSPSNSTSNKDRTAIFNIEWTSAPAN